LSKADLIKGREPVDRYRGGSAVWHEQKRPLTVRQQIAYDSQGDTAWSNISEARWKSDLDAHYNMRYYMPARKVQVAGYSSCRVIQHSLSNRHEQDTADARRRAEANLVYGKPGPVRQQMQDLLHNGEMRLKAVAAVIRRKQAVPTPDDLAADFGMGEIDDEPHWPPAPPLDEDLARRIAPKRTNSTINHNQDQPRTRGSRGNRKAQKRKRMGREAADK
jgi:hypothetical protein